jgi:hypothetical protein
MTPGRPVISKGLTVSLVGLAFTGLVLTSIMAWGNFGGGLSLSQFWNLGDQNLMRHNCSYMVTDIFRILAWVVFILTVWLW